MGALSVRGVEASIKIRGSSPHRREGNFPLAFGRCVRALWPNKTAFVLAEFAGTSDRAAKDWLSGKVPAPAIVIAAVIVEITKRN